MPSTRPYEPLLLSRDKEQLGTTGILLFGATCLATALGPWVFQTIVSKVKTKIFEYVVNREIIIVPPPSNSSSSNNTSSGHQENDATNRRQQRNVLLTIFPGAFLEHNEYISIAKEIQEQMAKLLASNTTACNGTAVEGNGEVNQTVTDWRLTVGIGPLMYFCTPPLVKWVFDNDNIRVAMAIRKMASKMTFSNEEDKVEEETPDASSFDDVFILGHSFGCYGAMDAAYSSIHSGMILYGGSWGLFMNRTPKDLMSYPCPTLTMIGERDGHIRYSLLSKDLKCRQDTLKQAAMQANTANDQNNNKQDTSVLERYMTLTKPIIAFPEMTHMHMSMGVVPLRTRLTGRSDLTSHYDNGPLKVPQSRLAKTVADFMYIHSKQHQQLPERSCQSSQPVEASILRQEAEERLLTHCQRTTELLDPFIELSSPIAKNAHIEQLVQSHMVPIILSSDLPTTINTTSLSLVAEWRENQRDFIHSKARLEQVVRPSHANQNNSTNGIPPSLATLMYLQLMEQDPINLAKFIRNKGPGSPPRIAQLSKTLVVKCSSLEAIREFVVPSKATAKDQERQLRAPNTLVQQMNQQTFDHVLNHIVTSEQWQRYMEEGSRLTFGPDHAIISSSSSSEVEIVSAFLQTPLLLDRPHDSEYKVDDEEVACNNIRPTYVLRSPYIETPTPLHPLEKNRRCGGGMYYFKPLTAGQAYEWIVFDSFKKIKTIL